MRCFERCQHERASCRLGIIAAKCLRQYVAKGGQQLAFWQAHHDNTPALPGRYSLDCDAAVAPTRLKSSAASANSQSRNVAIFGSFAVA